MNPKQKAKFLEIQEEEIEYYYDILNENIVDFDCGTLCKPDNNGVPFCCSVRNAVPYLYKKEFELLKKRTNLWKEWIPSNKQEIKMKMEQESDDGIFCECKGHQFCERENRSISCRTFPLEPYLDKRGVLVGLIYIKSFVHGCPLSKHPEKIRQEFIDTHFLFWEKLLLRKKDEYDMYLAASRTERRLRTKNKQEFKIFFPSHLKEREYLLKYI
ncbi:MAG: hypothetical protein H7A23_06975 [Leptospiraceae bacterium]|nr:hypothetical protein [Leptospiraceae bacterium]MCP5494281.1 hypothetical protein [Leptospiraceae bacterium]